MTAFDATGKVLATVRVGKAPMGLAVPRGTNKLYVGNEGSNSVSVISVTRHEVIATINVGSRPHHMYASADGSRVYVAEFGTNKIGVIDTMTDDLVAEWATGPPTERTHAPAPTQDGKTLYAVNSGTNTLVALDAHTGAIQWSMATGDNPSEFHVSRDGRTGYLSLRNADEIDVINLHNSSVSKLVFTGVRVAGHNWLSANGRYTFVSLDDPGGVGVIDHRTKSIVATWHYPGGGSVHGMFYDDPRATGGPGMSIPTRHTHVGKDGVARVRVACTVETAGPCRGTLLLAKRRRALGSGRFALRAGASARIAVKLSGRALNALARSGTLGCRATAKGSDMLEHKNTVSRLIVLRRAPR